MSSPKTHHSPKPTHTFTTNPNPTSPPPLLSASRSSDNNHDDNNHHHNGEEHEKLLNIVHRVQDTRMCGIALCSGFEKVVRGGSANNNVYCCGLKPPQYFWYVLRSEARA